MCGIAGIVRLTGDEPIDLLVVERMLDALVHRGPDGRGVVGLGSAALGAVRLAVRDTSSQGNQPMATADGRHHLVHNGELYDLAELRRLVRAPLRSDSDTEVLLHLLADGGGSTWTRVNGMFATAWWDAVEQRLVLARDRFGEKPLFWVRHAGCLLFASEEKALFTAGVPAELDPELLLFRYVAGERTPYAGVRRLLPGHELTVHRGAVTIRRWHEPSPGPAGADLGDLLARSVRRRLAADVPVGLFLSGGIDSSSVAALATEAAGPELPAFTVGYPGHRNDEVEHARAVADHLRLRLREIVVAPADLPVLLEEATWLRGQPIGHSASAHGLALARVAGEEVTVVLSGEGADELLGGYGHHRPHRYPHASTLAGHLVGPFRRHGRAAALARRARTPAHQRVVLSQAARLGTGPRTVTLPYRHEVARAARSSHPLRQVLDYDQHTHLAAVLATADRTTMGAGLEARAPFLDPEVADHLAELRPSELFERGTGKAPLRRAMAGRLPDVTLQRRKAGWTAPWHRYLREVPALRDYVRALPSHPLLDAAPVDRPIVDGAVRSFLDERPGGFDLVWALARITLWHDVCVRQQRGVLV